MTFVQRFGGALNLHVHFTASQRALIVTSNAPLKLVDEQRRPL